MLWKAEALVETGDNSRAVEIINRIRERARTSPTIGGGQPPAGTLSDREVNTSSKEQAMQWLMHEKRVELGFESNRFHDLKRWGTAEEVLTSMGKSYMPYNNLYPLPQSEIDKSGNEMKQNPNY